MVGGRYVGCCLAVLLMARPVQAQDTTVRAFVDRTVVGLNQMFVLSVEVSGSGSLDENPTLPDMSSFSQFLGSGSSRQIQIINGRTSTSLTFEYRFQATLEGRFEIAPIEVVVSGNRLATNPITIEVSKSAPSGGRAAQPRGAADPDIAPDDLFLRTEVDRTRVYQNEPVIVEYKLYTRVQVNSYSIASAPATGGFWVEEYELPASPITHTEVLDGREYLVATLKKSALFPTSAGTKTVDQMTVETQVRRRRRSRGLFDDFFGGSLGARVPHLITSDPVTIEVLPLPSRDRPEDFSGLVGSLQISASLDRTSVETNQALTLDVRLRGQGNLRTLALPEIEFPQSLEAYPPDVTERVSRDDTGVRGEKDYSYVLIPRAPGPVTIPPIQISYFDPVRESYVEVTTDSIIVDVIGDVTAPVIAGGARGGVVALREDIRFIRLDDTDFSPMGGTRLGPMFWATLILPLVAVGGAFATRRHRDRLQGDVAYARHRRASRVARRRLSAARKLARPDMSQSFYTETSKVLHGFLGDKLNVAEAGMIEEAVRELLSARQVSGTVADSYFDCIHICDRNRFVPSNVTTDEMTTLLGRVESAMFDLERELAAR